MPPGMTTDGDVEIERLVPLTPRSRGEGVTPARSPRFRVLDVPPEGPAVVREGDGAVAPPPAGTLRWIDLEAQDEQALALLRDRFGFHPLALEDCAHLGQRPKLEEYGDHIFVVTHSYCWGTEARTLELRELHAFLGGAYLVTVHEEPIEPLETTWRRVLGDPGLARRGSDFVLYLVVDAAVDANFPILDGVSERLDDLEDSVLDHADREDLERIFELKRVLAGMRRTLGPQRDVFGLLAKRGDARISEKTALYFRDVYDHVVRTHEIIDSSRDRLGAVLDAYLSMVANRTNEVMKRLGIMSAIFLPLTFITGFFGQNFDHLPFKSDGLMYAMIAACLLIPTGMLLWFHRSQWL